MKFLVSRLLWHSGACRLVRIQKDGYQLRFAPTAMAASLWVDPALSRADERFFREVIRPSDNVVDAGANIGALTVLASRLTGETGRVFAVEPHPRTAHWLRDNLAINACGNVEVIEAALAAVGGSARISDQRSDDQNCLTDGPAGIAIRAVTLDEVTRLIGDVRLLKLDLEGYELPALRGGTAVLARTEFVYFEVFDRHAERFGYHTADLAEFLVAAGFRLYRWDGAARHPVSPPWQAPRCENWIAERRGPGPGLGR